MSTLKVKFWLKLYNCFILFFFQSYVKTPPTSTTSSTLLCSVVSTSWVLPVSQPVTSNHCRAEYNVNPLSPVMMSKQGSSLRVMRAAFQHVFQRERLSLSITHVQAIDGHLLHKGLQTRIDREGSDGGRRLVFPTWVRLHQHETLRAERVKKTTSSQVTF